MLKSHWTIDLAAADAARADPYCLISCNEHLLRTSVMWGNVNPDFYESFEIDVTNPSAVLFIQVKDKEFFGADDLIGQVSIPLSSYSDGKEYHLTMPLRGESNRPEEFDRGDIELRLRWAQRFFEDDQVKNAMILGMIVRLQSWFRTTLAMRELLLLKTNFANRLETAKMYARKITTACRARLAQKIMKRLMRMKK